MAPPLQLTCLSQPRPTRGLEQGSGPGVCWACPGTGRRHPDRAYGPLGSLQVLLAEPLVHLVGQGSQIVEGGGAVSHEEVFDFLGEPASVCITEGDVIPSAVSCYSLELKCVVRDTPAPLFDRVEVDVGWSRTFVGRVPLLPLPNPGPSQLGRT